MKLVNHAFAFRADLDSPDIEIMAYSYGKRSSDLDIKDYGRSNQNNSIRGDMVVGDSLYVKWRIKATNEVFEDTVDLLSRLPKNMTDQRLYFVVQGKQLLVFLTDLNTLKPKESPIVGPFKTQSYLTKQLYPNN